MCARLIRLPFVVTIITAFCLLPAALQAGEKQEKMEKSKTEMEKAAEEVQTVDPAAGPVDEATPQVNDSMETMETPESKAVYKKSEEELTTDQDKPE
ncbi:hypothetical protein [Emcibacter nanhaiensis]|uniref:Uncharacterized protein n=1 Tax=Emcibacter nanhaiensis TaxID=1505037 RepID=A0A501PSL8_9PROT|nr:hypothetical protein [Emcibacter nanhaiensis]TPD62954.1 hypothetical protein FIV46_02420 [Emcibacter nanhaiensis]